MSNALLSYVWTLACRRRFIDILDIVTADRDIRYGTGYQDLKVL